MLFRHQPIVGDTCYQNESGVALTGADSKRQREMVESIRKHDGTCAGEKHPQEQKARVSSSRRGLEEPGQNLHLLPSRNAQAEGSG